MSELSFRKPILWIIGLIVLVCAIWYFASSENPLKSSIGTFVDSLLGTNVSVKLVEVNADLPFYNEFVKNYKECKFSASTDCFCPLTNPSTPENYVIELTNNPKSKTTAIVVHGNVQQKKECGTMQATNSIKDIKEVSTIISDDALYFKNYRIFVAGITDPLTAISDAFSKSKSVQSKIIPAKDFVQVDSLFLYKTDICTTTNVVGSASISTTNAAIYKFDKEKTTIISEVFSGLKQCAIAKDIVPAEEQFNKILVALNSCTNSPCPISIKSGEGVDSVIPKDYNILIKGQNLVMEYKGTSVKTAEIKIEPCLFVSFMHIQPEDGVKLETLNFNDYIGYEVYPFSNKVCILPYTVETKKQKDLFFVQLKNKPLLPA